MDHSASRPAPPGAADRAATERARAWQARARDLVDLCAVSAPCEEADRLTEALALLDEKALPAGSPAGLPADGPDLGAMIAAGGSLSAAMDLLGPRAGYLLSHAPGGSCMATVVFPAHGHEETAEGTTPALAVLAAHFAALLVLLDDSRAVTERPAGPAALRLN